MPFFLSAPRFVTFLLKHAQKPFIFVQGRDLFLQDFRVFNRFYTLPFSPFLITLLQWLIFYWACFQFKKIWESIIEMGKFYNAVATCSQRQFDNGCLMWTDFMFNFRCLISFHLTSIPVIHTVQVHVWLIIFSKHFNEHFLHIIGVCHMATGKELSLRHEDCCCLITLQWNETK